MPIVDKELVHERHMEELKTSNQAVGDYLMETFKSHITKHGDTQWMVSLFKYSIE